MIGWERLEVNPKWPVREKKAIPREWAEPAQAGSAQEEPKAKKKSGTSKIIAAILGVYFATLVYCGLTPAPDVPKFPSSISLDQQLTMLDKRIGK